MKNISGARSALLSIFALGASLTMAQQPSGAIRAWGDNERSQLGDGLIGNALVPESVLGLTDVVAVAGGPFYSLGLKSDGSVFAWGFDQAGEMGVADASFPASHPLPVPVVGLGPGSGVIAISAGDHHSVALKADGSVWTWGGNEVGQLGIANLERSSVPIQVPSLGPGSGVIAIAAGHLHTLALKGDGTVLAWGFSPNLGVGKANTPIGTIVTVTSDAIAIAAGSDHSLVLRADGAVVGWGEDGDGQVGDGSTGTAVFFPIAVAGLGSGSGVIAIAAGETHSLALKSDGSVLAWGDNRTGELGDGTLNPHATPAAVSGVGSGVVSLSGGAGFSQALKSDGSVLSWGRNERGQLGDGTSTDRPTPVQVVNLNGSVALAQGTKRFHNFAIVQPVAALSSTALSFGDQLVGSLSPAQMLIIQNKGQDPLVIKNLSVSGNAADFTLSSPPLPFSVAPGTSAAISVAFSPTAAFARLATLLVDGNLFDAPQTVALTGNGLAQSDVGIAMSASDTRVKNRGNLTYTISVNNAGPTAAPSVVMTDSLPEGLTFVSVKPSQGSCLNPAPGFTGTVTCNLGTIDNGAKATITLVVTVNSPSTQPVANSSSAVAQAPDPNLGNNSATLITSVFGPKH
ncbi:MAG TPA: choice-of-anchor D domain-containing protein [Bryobacteraceae bacterium]